MRMCLFVQTLTQANTQVRQFFTIKLINFGLRNDAGMSYSNTLIENFCYVRTHYQLKSRRNFKESSVVRMAIMLTKYTSTVMHMDISF